MTQAEIYLIKYYSFNYTRRTTQKSPLFLLHFLLKYTSREIIKASVLLTHMLLTFFILFVLTYHFAKAFLGMVAFSFLSCLIFSNRAQHLKRPIYGTPAASPLQSEHTFRKSTPMSENLEDERIWDLFKLVAPPTQTIIEYLITKIIVNELSPRTYKYFFYFETIIMSKIVNEKKL